MIFLNKAGSYNLVKTMCYPMQTNRLDRGQLFFIPAPSEIEALQIMDKFKENRSNVRLKLPKVVYLPYKEKLFYGAVAKMWVDKDYNNNVKDRKNRGYTKVTYMNPALSDYNGFIDYSIAIESLLSKAKYTLGNSIGFWRSILKPIDLPHHKKFLVFTTDNMRVKVNTINSITAKNGLNSSNLYLNFLFNLKFHYEDMVNLLRESDYSLIFTDYRFSLYVDNKDIPDDHKEFYTNLFAMLRRMKTGIEIDPEEGDGEFVEEDINNEEEQDIVTTELLDKVQKINEKGIKNKENILTLVNEEEVADITSTNKKDQAAIENAIRINHLITESRVRDLPAISERAKKVDKRYKEIKEKHLTEVIAELENNEMNLIEKKEVPVSKVKEYSEFKIENMDKQYEATAKKARVEMGDNISKGATPLFLSNYKEKEDETSVDNKCKSVSYTFQSPDNSKNSHSFTVRVPELRDGKFLHINGSDKVMVRQKMTLPITRLGNEVLFSSYFGKVFISVSRGNLSKPLGKIKRYFKYIRKKYKADVLGKYFDFTPAYFDLKNKNDVHEEILEVSRFCTRINVRDNYISFKDPNKEFAKIDNVIYTVDPVNNEITDKNGVSISLLDLFSKLLTGENDEVIKLWETIAKKKETTTMAYSNAKILSKDTPLLILILHAFDEILVDLLDILKEDYGLEYKMRFFKNGKKEPRLYSDDEGDQFVFDGFTLDVKYNGIPNRLLLQYLHEIDLSSYKNLKLKGLVESLYNSQHIINMENYRDYFIDNVATKQILDDMGIPSTWGEALIYCNNLLINYDRSIKEISLANERMPSNSEVIHGLLYKEMAEAMIDYSNKVKRGSKSATFSVEKDAVIKKLLVLPNVEESSKLNPIQHIDKTYTISNKGVNGINNERSYTSSKVAWDDSFYGIMSDVSPYTKSAGIAKHLAVNPNITDMKGYFKSKDPKEVTDSEIMSIAETLAPFAQKHDSAPRLAMLMSQYNHTVDVNGAEPALVTYGMDETMNELDTDFNFKMEDDGSIIEINDRFVKVRYDNLKDDKGRGLVRVFNIDKIERNSAKAKYILNKMELNPKINKKPGTKIKKGTVIAYNKNFYHNTGEEIVYKPGPIAWVALANNQSSHEDATVMNVRLAKKLGTTNLKRIAIKLHPRYKIVETANIGSIKPGDVIIKYSEDTGSDFYNSKIDLNLLDDYLLKIKKSNYKGSIRDIYIYYKLTQEEYENMDPTIVEFFNKVKNYYNKNFNSNNIALELAGYEKNRVVDHITKFSGSKKSKVNGDSVDNGEILIEFFIEVETPFSIGDKIIFGSSALKGVCSKIVKDEDSPYGDTTGRKIDAILSTYSPASRMIYSLFMNSSLMGCMMQINNEIRKKLGLEEKWK